MDEETVTKMMIDGLLSKGYVIGNLDDNLLIDIRDIMYEACNSVKSDCSGTEEEAIRLAKEEEYNKLLEEANILDCPYDFTSRCTMDRCNCKPKNLK